MAGGAGFVSDSINTLKNNKGIRTRRSFLNGGGYGVKAEKWIAPKRTAQEEIIFQNKMKAAKRRGLKREIVMYAISSLIVLMFIILINKFFI